MAGILYIIYWTSRFFSHEGKNFSTSGCDSESSHIMSLNWSLLSTYLSPPRSLADRTESGWPWLAHDWGLTGLEAPMALSRLQSQLHPPFSDRLLRARLPSTFHQIYTTLPTPQQHQANTFFKICNLQENCCSTQE